MLLLIYLGPRGVLSKRGLFFVILFGHRCSRAGLSRYERPADFMHP
jgi:hypothetical protein